jgi:hypothetical protein
MPAFLIRSTIIAVGTLILNCEYVVLQIIIVATVAESNTFASLGLLQSHRGPKQKEADEYVSKL